MDVPESGSRPQEAPGRRSFCPVLLASASKQSFWKASPTLHPDVLKRCHHQSVLPPETPGLPVLVQIRGLPEGAMFSAPGTRCPPSSCCLCLLSHYPLDCSAAHLRRDPFALGSLLMLTPLGWRPASGSSHQLVLVSWWFQPLECAIFPSIVHTSE